MTKRDHLVVKKVKVKGPQTLLSKFSAISQGGQILLHKFWGALSDTFYLPKGRSWTDLLRLVERIELTLPDVHTCHLLPSVHLWTPPWGQKRGSKLLKSTFLASLPYIHALCMDKKDPQGKPDLMVVFLAMYDLPLGAANGVKIDLSCHFALVLD